ncbi:hypothetical protein ERO13_A11G237550v2 [Gossypium hirsutum]|nr:hypothetical protein ERO13_A11G237550v2 [Gossypium hirsutum]
MYALGAHVARGGKNNIKNTKKEIKIQKLIQRRLRLSRSRSLLYQVGFKEKNGDKDGIYTKRVKTDVSSRRYPLGHCFP